MYTQREQQSLLFRETEAIVLGLIALARKKRHLSAEAIRLPELPAHSGDAYADFIRRYRLNENERCMFAMSLLPELRPMRMRELAEQFKTKPELGLLRGANDTWLPSFRTLCFLLAVGDETALPDYFYLLDSRSRPLRLGLVETVEGEQRHGLLQTAFVPAREAFQSALEGYVPAPAFGPDFPAQRISTRHRMADLVLHPQTLRQVEEIHVWLKHARTMREDWGMGRRLKPGFRALFHGPPGTGKTLTASLLGKLTERDVYRIDLSQVVSKYIGETEKNLRKIFDKAENKDWILFFDEADSLFGKRGKVSDARDRYANQEVSYLLQRVEDFDGLVILATNYKSNLDDAFMRRFQSVVHFPFPRSSERHRLWKQMLPSRATLQPGLSLHDVSRKYELSGASILNVVQYAVLMTIERGDQVIHAADIEEGVRREYDKEGKVI